MHGIIIIVPREREQGITGFRKIIPAGQKEDDSYGLTKAHTYNNCKSKK
jgi:hypothetical protein